ncbi:MAG TPA: hypothetical protein VLH79_16185 [Chthonomonadales bacterium]|nr:hypothetical protein [Chthonomonadales bacterium]
MNSGDLGPAIIALAMLLIPIVAIVAAHRRKVLELQLQLRSQADSLIAGEIRSLREQLEGLRDTTTRYDVSFDTALQRMETRMARLEQRVESSEAAAYRSVGA